VVQALLGDGAYALGSPLAIFSGGAQLSGVHSR
jgi:hypothetical protein